MAQLKQKVALEDVQIYAYHGYYPQEQLVGGEYLVSLETVLEVFDPQHEDLSSTVNYERLFAIISEEMARPRKLLETVAHAILDQVRHEFIAVKEIRVSIRKMNPPLPGEVGASKVELSFNR